ncbi:MAG: CIA30 family protein [Planctomycetota bacterium]
MRYALTVVLLLFFCAFAPPASYGGDPLLPTTDDPPPTRHVENASGQELFLARLVAIEPVGTRRFSWDMTFERVTDRKRLRLTRVWDTDPLAAGLGFTRWEHGQDGVEARIAAAPPVLMVVGPTRSDDVWHLGESTVRSYFVIDESVAGQRLYLGDAATTPGSTAPGDRHGRPEIELLTDFTDPVRNDRWYIRNDDVMGGRSLGEMRIDPDGSGTLTMSGSINLNGGGFTSVLMDVTPPPPEEGADNAAEAWPDFAGVRGIRLRVRASGEPTHRPYRLRVEDGVRRDQPVNFRGLITLSVAVPDDRWQTVTVWLQHLRPTIRGREVDPADWAPLDVSQVRRLGVVLNDTGGGPYRLEIDRIELVR